MLLSLDVQTKSEFDFIVLQQSCTKSIFPKRNIYSTKIKKIVNYTHEYCNHLNTKKKKNKCFTETTYLYLIEADLRLRSMILFSFDNKWAPSLDTNRKISSLCLDLLSIYHNIIIGVYHAGWSTSVTCSFSNFMEGLSFHGHAEFFQLIINSQEEFVACPLRMCLFYILLFRCPPAFQPF